MVSMRPIVAETAERVPFPPIDFEETNDESGKAIRAAVPNWNIATAELERLVNGDYNSHVRLNGKSPVQLLAFVHLLKHTWRYVTPKEERGYAIESVFEEAEGKLKRRQPIWEYTTNHTLFVQFLKDNPDHELAKGAFPNVTFPYDLGDVAEMSQYWVLYAVRHVLSKKFLFNLLSKTRELLVNDNGEPSAETTYHPFSGGHKHALNSLISCLHLILRDHHGRDVHVDYQNESRDEYTAPGDVSCASHWSQLYQYLRQEIEQNGPVPEQLQFFYGSVELGSRLERLTEAEMDTLFAIQNKDAERLFESIVAARSHYGVVYERW